MKIQPLLRKYRWLLIGSALLALAALLIDREATTDTPAPPSSTAVTETSASPPSPNVPATTAAPREDVSPAAPDTPTGGQVDIFAVRTWDPPAPVPDPATVAASPPPPPEPPPLPFRYAGRLEEPGKPPVFFILRGEKVLAVHPGELINGHYRVGTIEGGQLHFFYRPMKIRQSIPVGGDT